MTLKNQFRQRYCAVMVFQRSGLAYVLPDSQNRTVRWCTVRRGEVLHKERGVDAAEAEVVGIAQVLRTPLYLLQPPFPPIFR